MKIKNRSTSTILAIIPGLGHFYLGLYIKGLKIIAAIIAAVIIQALIILPLLNLTLGKIVSEESDLGKEIFAILSIPFWIYVWQIKDAYNSSDDINYPEQKIPHNKGFLMRLLKKSVTWTSAQEFKIMAGKFFQEHALADESLTEYANVIEFPSWWYGLENVFSFLIMMKHDIFILTNKRIILITLDITYAPKSFSAYDLTETKLLKLSKNPLYSTLNLQFSSGQTRRLSFYKIRGLSQKAETIAKFIQNTNINKVK